MPHPEPDSTAPAWSNRKNSVPPPMGPWPPTPLTRGALEGGNARGTVAGLGGGGVMQRGVGALMGSLPVQKQRHRINRGTGMGGMGVEGVGGGGTNRGSQLQPQPPAMAESCILQPPGYPTSVCLCLSVHPSSPWCSVDVIVDAGGVWGGGFGLLLLAGSQPRGSTHQPQVGLLLLGLTGLGVVGTGFGRS